MQQLFHLHHCYAVSEEQQKRKERERSLKGKKEVRGKVANHSMEQSRESRWNESAKNWRKRPEEMW